MKNKIICFLIGHDDPIMDLLDKIHQDELYKQWRFIVRGCRRCGKDLTREIITKRNK